MATTINGHFVWHELMAKNVKDAIAFYTDVAGWKTQPFEGTDYTMWTASQGPLGGVIAQPEDAAKMGAPPMWMGHVQVEDVDASAALVKKLGGKIHHGPTDIPNVGRFCVIADPQGAIVSMFKPGGGPMTQHEIKPGEFCWNELLTSDSESAFTFYAQLFGWKSLQEMDMGPMGKYRIYGVGERQLGGMMTLPKGAPMPPAWLHYIETSDLEGALAKAKAKGAKVINGPMDVPGGRIVQLIDPQGAATALHQQKKS